MIDQPKSNEKLLHDYDGRAWVMNNNKIKIEKFFKLLDVPNYETLKNLSKETGIPISRLQYYNDNMILPMGEDMDRLCAYTGYSKELIEIKLGHISPEVQSWIISHGEDILKEIAVPDLKVPEVSPVFNTSFGTLFHDDCVKVLAGLPDESVDMVFADPPFNLNKDYGDSIDDDMTKSKYINWCEVWIKECARVLKSGGAFYIYNLPYWNTFLSNILNKYMNFRHWIAVSMKGLIPVQGKLQPEHYGLLYYIKGEKPKVFNKQRIPLVTCRHCGGEIRDYGGKKSSLNPEGISISDIFMDINPVRHKKYKNRSANELPLRLLHRLISLSTDAGDIVLDPFGGAGTTYVAAEFLERNWIGMEIGDTDIIMERLEKNERDKELLLKIEKESNILFTEEQVRLRQKNNFWTYEKLRD